MSPSDPVNYAARKLALGIRPTNLDTGFMGDFGSKYEEPKYLTGKIRDRRKEPSGRRRVKR